MIPYVDRSVATCESFIIVLLVPDSNCKHSSSSYTWTISLPVNVISANWEASYGCADMIKILHTWHETNFLAGGIKSWTNLSMTWVPNISSWVMFSTTQNQAPMERVSMPSNVDTVYSICMLLECAVCILGSSMVCWCAFQLWDVTYFLTLLVFNPVSTQTSCFHHFSFADVYLNVFLIVWLAKEIWYVEICIIFIRNFKIIICCLRYCLYVCISWFSLRGSSYACKHLGNAYPNCSWH